MMRSEFETMNIEADEKRGAFAVETRANEMSYMRRSPRVWRDVEFALLAVWLGAAIFVTAVVAPSAFDVLPTRALAGALVGRTLAVLNVSGFAIGMLLLIVSFLKSARRFAWLERALLAIVALACGAGQWVITARLERLRALMGRPIDELAANDPLRAEFGALHGVSVLVLGAGMLASLIVLALRVWRRES
jgi:hypothetical protein